MIQQSTSHHFYFLDSFLRIFSLFRLLWTFKIRLEILHFYASHIQWWQLRYHYVLFIISLGTLLELASGCGWSPGPNFKVRILFFGGCKFVAVLGKIDGVAEIRLHFVLVRERVIFARQPRKVAWIGSNHLKRRVQQPWQSRLFLQLLLVKSVHSVHITAAFSVVCDKFETLLFFGFEEFLVTPLQWFIARALESLSLTNLLFHLNWNSLR